MNKFTKAQLKAMHIDVSTIAPIVFCTDLNRWFAGVSDGGLTADDTTVLITGNGSPIFWKSIEKGRSLDGTINDSNWSGADLAVVNGGTGTSTGSIAGTGALTFTAGGTAQNITLTPSTTGYTILNGNVGIGTTSPTTILTIRKPIDWYGYGAGTQMIDFKSYLSGYDVETVKASIYAGVSGLLEQRTDNGYLAFMTANSGVLYERLRIEKNGNVGIGTTSPTNGTLEVTGPIYTSGNCSALSFTDRTPFYDGDALSEINNITGKSGNVDHDSLPDFVKHIHENKETKVKTTERNLGNMISMLTVSTQQLSGIIEKQNKTINKLLNRIEILEKR